MRFVRLFRFETLGNHFASLFFREHLGTLDCPSDEDIRDVVSDSFYEVTLAELSRLLKLFCWLFLILIYVLLVRFRYLRDVTIEKSCSFDLDKQFTSQACRNRRVCQL